MNQTQIIGHASSGSADLAPPRRCGTGTADSPDNFLLAYSKDSGGFPAGRRNPTEPRSGLSVSPAPASAMPSAEARETRRDVAGTNAPPDLNERTFVPHDKSPGTGEEGNLLAATPGDLAHMIHAAPAVERLAQIGFPVSAGAKTVDQLPGGLGSIAAGPTVGSPSIQTDIGTVSGRTCDTANPGSGKGIRTPSALDLPSAASDLENIVSEGADPMAAQPTAGNAQTAADPFFRPGGESSGRSANAVFGPPSNTLLSAEPAGLTRPPADPAFSVRPGTDTSPPRTGSGPPTGGFPEPATAIASRSAIAGEPAGTTAQSAPVSARMSPRLTAENATADGDTQNGPAQSSTAAPGQNQAGIAAQGAPDTNLSPLPGADPGGADGAGRNAAGLFLSEGELNHAGVSGAAGYPDEKFIPPANHHSRPDLPQARQVALQIAGAARMVPDRPVEISLNPEELGKLRMTLAASDGAISVTLLAERGETADLIRRHLETLAQEFRQIGYREVNFSFAGQGDGQQSDRSGDFGTGPKERLDLETASEGDSARTPVRITLTDRVDIRL